MSRCLIYPWTVLYPTTLVYPDGIDCPDPGIGAWVNLKPVPRLHRANYFRT